MGCDGGSIPLRADMIRVKKKKMALDKETERSIKWKLCALSGEPLRQPIVACELGKLYNKEAILEYLLNRAAAKTDVASHVRNLKDVKELKLTEKASAKKAESDKADKFVDTNDAQFVCPVVGVEMSGSHKFAFIWGCGCVLSDRALREVPGRNCHKCGAAFSEEDIVALQPDESELESQKERMEKRRLAAKLAKKAKRKAVETEGESSSASASTSSASPPDDEALPAKIAKKSAAAGVSARGGASTSSAKKPSIGTLPQRQANVVLRGATRSALNVAEAAMTGLVAAKQYKTVAEDPTASKAYKSLFTSGSKRDHSKPPGNWVVTPAYHL